MAEHALIGVDDAGLGGVPDRAAPDEVCGQGSLERFTDVATRLPTDDLRHAAYGVVGDGDVGRVGSAVALLAGHPPAEAPSHPDRGDRVVEGLHDQGDDRALRPVLHVIEVDRLPALGPQLAAPGLESVFAHDLVRQHGLHECHRVGALAVADGLDVGVLIGMERGGDRDALGVVHGQVGSQRPENGLGVGACQDTEPVRDVGQVALALELVEELLRAEGRSREDDLIGRERAHGCPPRHLRLRPARLDGVAALSARSHPRDGGQRVHDGAVGLSKVEVVLHQRVLRVVPAPRHALTAPDARGTLRAGAPEVGVGMLAATLVGPVVDVAEEHPDRSGVEGVRNPHLLCDLLHHLVRWRVPRRLDHAQHPLRLVVVGLELGLPVGDVRPGRVAVERVERLVERVGVDQRAAADPGTSQDHAVLDHVDALDAVHPQRRGEEELLRVERRGREAGVVEACTCFEDADAVALLGEPQRGDRSTEPGADDQDVVVGHARPSFFSNRSCAVIILAYVSSDMPSMGAKRTNRWVATDCDSV